VNVDYDRHIKPIRRWNWTTTSLWSVVQEQVDTDVDRRVAILHMHVHASNQPFLGGGGGSRSSMAATKSVWLDIVIQQSR
jgi:hypothetical protein